MIAAAAVRALTHRVTTGQGSVSRLSLAGTAAALTSEGRAAEEAEIRLPLDGPHEGGVSVSGDGRPVKRLRFPATIEHTPLLWGRPFEPSGSSVPRWSTSYGARPASAPAVAAIRGGRGFVGPGRPWKFLWFARCSSHPHGAWSGLRTLGQRGHLRPVVPRLEPLGVDLADDREGGAAEEDPQRRVNAGVRSVPCRDCTSSPSGRARAARRPSLLASVTRPPGKRPIRRPLPARLAEHRLDRKSQRHSATSTPCTPTAAYRLP
ncbi:hypothetical protein SGLAM104S_02014 [Streptomyces glaucescens]